jgi:hypothetical protein
LIHPEVQHQLGALPRETVTVQPEDLGSGPALLLPLLLIHKSASRRHVAIFPADNFIVEEELFMTQVAMAFYMVEKNPTDVVLLGVEPDSDDPDYSYIVCEGEAPSARPMFGTSSKKPTPRRRASLPRNPRCGTRRRSSFAPTRLFISSGASRRSFIERCARSRRRSVRERRKTSLSGRSAGSSRSRLPPTCCKKCAALRPARIRALPVAGVFWSDWRSEERIVESLKRTGYFDRLKKNR